MLASTADDDEALLLAGVRGCSIVLHIARGRSPPDEQFLEDLGRVVDAAPPADATPLDRSQVELLHRLADGLTLGRRGARPRPVPAHGDAPARRRPAPPRGQLDDDGDPRGTSRRLTIPPFCRSERAGSSRRLRVETPTTAQQASPAG